MSNYKLIVVSPFNDFKKGDQIMDASIIDKILDPSHEMHEHDGKCRRVLKSSVEKQMYIAPTPENSMPANSEPKPADAAINIESINSKAQNFSKPS